MRTDREHQNLEPCQGHSPSLLLSQEGRSQKRKDPRNPVRDFIHEALNSGVRQLEAHRCPFLLSVTLGKGESREAWMSLLVIWCDSKYFTAHCGD